jgi:hypothetical protein
MTADKFFWTLSAKAFGEPSAPLFDICNTKDMLRVEFTRATFPRCGIVGDPTDIPNHKLYDLK